MTDRERFITTMQFGEPDRVPYRFGFPREATLKAWYKQGLPKDIDFCEFVGMDRWEELPINLGPVPPFEERTISETDRHRIWIDSLGIKRIDHKVLPTPGFVTRKYLEFPVKNRKDFLEMMKRYDASSKERYHGVDLESRKQQRSFVLGLTIQSMFWRLRDWVGLEGLCMLFYDNPGLVHEMMEYVCEFTIEVLTPALTEVSIDYVFFNEDMAYKTASMISPKLVREFMLPRYVKLVRFFREKNIPSLIMDCDGNISELIPIWLEAGINCVYPVEIAAGNDIIEYRKRYGKSLAMIGGIDKRELRFDKARVRAEVIKKVPYLIQQGGYIPSVDHAVPPDVPLRNYLYMCELIKAIACNYNKEIPEPKCELEAKLGEIEELWSHEKAWMIEEGE